MTGKEILVVLTMILLAAIKREEINHTEIKYCSKKYSGLLEIILLMHADSDLLIMCATIIRKLILGFWFAGTWKLFLKLGN